MVVAHERGQEWLAINEVVRAVQTANPATNRGSISADLKFHCINDPSKKHSPGLQYLKNPLVVTDDPTMHGKRYRLLTEDERETFFRNPRRDLELVSYAQLLEWLRDPVEALVPQSEELEQETTEAVEEVLGGPALIELHLQDYLFRNWRSVFPDLELYNGGHGREFVTSNPEVGVIDFLCRDRQGNFVVIETKRAAPDRQAVGQILGYMGWVQQKLCQGSETVRGVLVSNDATERLRMAVAAVPNLELYLYEISFQLSPDRPAPH
jgi:Endonuclease NucS